MKRKFSFNLAPVKVPLRSDSLSAAKHSAEPSTAKSSSHRRHFSKDSIIPSLDSPYICRRPLDPRTEQELRVACALILKNFKPSDAGFADADPKLDFSGPHKPRAPKPDTSHVQVRRPTGAPAEHHRGRDATRSHVTAVNAYDQPMRANTGRRRAENEADKDVETRRYIKSPTDAPRSATIRTDVDSDDGKSLGTPLTASTDAHHNNGSTAPTSVAVISGKSSKRESHQYESAAAAADAQAAEWMQQQLERRRQQQPHQSRPETSHRPPSRASSIKAGIKEYFIPGSGQLSRSQSRDSMRTTDSQASREPKRSGSSHGWRSWGGLNRRSSSRTSRSNSRPGTSSGRVERGEEKKPELNLNRELPPLPSLDTWTEPEPELPKEQPREHRKSQLQGAHIATLMRAQDQRQDYAAAVRQHHRRSGSDTLALRYQSAQASVPLQSPTKSLHEKRSPPARAHASEHSMDFDQMMSAMSSNRHLDDQLALHSNNDGSYAPHRSASTLSQSGKHSTDGHLNAPNFSRKISTEVPRSPKEKKPYKNVVQVSGPAKDEQKSKLRRVLSGWMLKKEKKEDWMGKVEKQGVRNGVMVQEEAALPPVVRY